MSATALSPAPAAATGRLPPAGGSRLTVRIALGVLACLVAGLLLYAIRPSPPTDDTYAFLDWGRDVRHGLVPAISGRTFHPVPVLYGAVVTVLGSGALSVTVVLSLAGLFGIALAAWRTLVLLDVPQPGPAVAALLVLANPVLPALAFAAYVNLWFAVVIAWAVVCELAGRRRMAWSLLLLAGLLRPEGWAFTVAYGTLAWWRAGRGRDRRGWSGPLLLALAPILLWAGTEWLAFGSPLYSFTHTAKLRDTAAHVVGHLTLQAELWHDLRDSVTWPLMVFGLLGIGALVARSRAGDGPGRDLRGFAVLAVTCPLTIAVLAASGLNVPSRHFSALDVVAIELAACGAGLGPRLVLRSAGRAHRAAAAAVLLALALSISVRPLRDEFRSVAASRAYDGSLREAIAARPALTRLPLGTGSAAIIGAIAQSELVWTLGVPYSVVSGERYRTTRMIVQPDERLWAHLFAIGLTDRPRTARPAGWRRIVSGRWEIYLEPRLAAGLPSSATS